MATIPRRYIDNYTRSLEQLSAGAQQALAERIQQVDFSDMTEAANELVGIMEDYCSSTAEASAEIAAAFYEGMSVYQTGESFDALPDSGHVPEATERATRGIFQQAVDGNIPSMTTQLLERLDFETKKAAGETIFSNSARDKREPRYARIPSGGETCDFCIMLASRGPVYRSAASAGELNHYHAHCRCRVVPMWDTAYAGPSRRAGMAIEGYDPDALYSQYLDNMLDPAYRQRMLRGSIRARSGGTSTRTPQMPGSPTSWVRSYREGLTRFRDMGAVEDFIKSASTYEELFERIDVLNKEAEYMFLGKTQQQLITDLLRGQRRRILGIQ